MMELLLPQVDVPADAADESEELSRRLAEALHAGAAARRAKATRTSRPKSSSRRP